MSEEYTTATRASQFRIASCNLHFAGIAPDGGGTAWQASMTALRALDPDVVLVQEMNAPQGVLAGLQAHLWRTANELAMIPVLGQPGPLSVTGNRPAILVRTPGLAILDAGPPPFADPGSTAAAWCYALLQVPAISDPVEAYSVHMPARDQVEQCSQARARPGLR